MLADDLQFQQLVCSVYPLQTLDFVLDTWLRCYKVPDHLDHSFRIDCNNVVYVYPCPDAV